MTFQIVGDFAQAIATANNANTTLVVPKGFMIFAMSMVETLGNAVTGGVKVGKTSGAADVVAAQAVGANSANGLADSAILIKMFSTTSDQTLFIQPVSSWNNAIVNIKVYLLRAV